MSLAVAIQKAAPFLQNEQTIQTLLNGGNPFSNIPGFTTGSTQSSEDGSSSSTNDATGDVLKAVMDKLRTTAAPVNSSVVSAVTGGAGLPASSAPVPIFTPPAYSNPFSGLDLPGGGSKDLDTFLHNAYNNSNFNHYAAPDGSSLPFVGPNYEKYGAMQGYVYDPYTDRYKTNENTLLDTVKAQGGVTNSAKIAQEFGLAPQTPSTGSTLLNGILGILGTGLAGGLSSNLFGGGSSGSLLSQLLGSGASSGSSGSDIASSLLSDALLGGNIGNNLVPGGILNIGGDSGGGGGDFLGTVGSLASLGGLF